MKHISKLFFLSILTFLVACGGNDNSIEGKKASLEQLKKQQEEFLAKHGQLGNQMFQYAFAYNLSKKLNLSDQV